MSSTLSMSATLSTLPGWALAAIVALAVAVITLDVFALRDLYRRPTSQVVFAKKWIWIAIILLTSSGPGAIIYLAAGRRPAVLTDDAAPSESTSVSTERVADTLYGPRNEPDRQ